MSVTVHGEPLDSMCLDVISKAQGELAEVKAQWIAVTIRMMQLSQAIAILETQYDVEKRTDVSWRHKLAKLKREMEAPF